MIRLTFLIVALILGAARPALAQPQTSSAAIPAERQANNVAIITLRTGDDPIDSVMAKSFIRRLKIAESAGADAIVVELDTPGGEINAILDICAAIKASSIKNSVAWINTRAFSGGALIALACREIVVNDAASWGDALPIAFGPGGLRELKAEERGKLLQPLLTEVVDSARRRNQSGYAYDELLVQSILAPGAELWLVRDKTTGIELCITRAEYQMLFDGPPPTASPRVASLNPGRGLNPNELPIFPRPHESPGGPTGLTDKEREDLAIQPASPRLAPLMEHASAGVSLPRTRPQITPADKGRYELVEFVTDGTGPVVLKATDLRVLHLAANPSGIQNDEDLKAWFGAQNLGRLDPLWSEGLVQFMSLMTVRGVLVFIFLVALFLEMVAPSGLAGLFAAIALTLLIVPPFLMGMANWWEILAILGGIVLLLLEIFVLPGFGVPGVLGVLLFFGGLIGTFVPDQGGSLFPTTAEGRQDLMYGILTITLALATSGVGWWYIVKRFGSIPLLNKLILKDASDDDASLLGAMAPISAGPVKIGDVGVAVTPLRPVGRAEIAGRVIDVVAEGGYIDAGQPVRVEDVTQFRTVVSASGASPLA